MKKFLLLALLVLPLSVRSAVQHIIDTNVCVTVLPSSAAWNAEGGVQPPTNILQTINPPFTRWLYLESPQAFILTNAARKYEVKFYTNLLTAPVIDVDNISNNFYNCWAPITYANGSTYSNTVWWQVTYKTLDGNVQGLSPMYSFQMIPNAPQLDRSVWTNDAYMISIASHPSLFMKSNNILSLNHFLWTNIWEYPGYHATDITNDARIIIALSYYNSTTVTNQGTFLTESMNVAKVGWAMQICSVTNQAFFQTLTNSNPGGALENLATNYLLFGVDKLDGYSAGNIPWAFAEAYDWIEPYMTAQQKSNCLYFMECEVKGFIYNNWLYFSQSTNSDGTYDRTISHPLIQSLGSNFREGESHSRNGEMGLSLCLAGMGDSATLRGYLHWFLDYYYVQFDPWQGGDGRHYNSVQNFQLQRQATAWAILACSFPQSGITNAPIYNDILSQYAYYLPVGYGHDNTTVPYSWGVIGDTPPYTYYSEWGDTRMYVASLITQNGAALQQYENQKPFNQNQQETVDKDDTIEPMVPYFFPPPTQTAWATNKYLDMRRGWYMNLSTTPDQSDAWTNQIGFITQARPSGSERNNSPPVDGGLEMWAYGAHITGGGSANYEEWSKFHANPATWVSGIGHNIMSPPVAYPVHAYFTFETNNSDYAAIGEDLTDTFSHTNWPSPGVQNIVNGFNQQSTNARPDIVSITRTVLFLHHRYWTIIDHMVTSSPEQFGFSWNSWDPSPISVDTNGVKFVYQETNTYNNQYVKVYVNQNINSGLLHCIDLNSGGNYYGTNVLNLSKMNPLTGENYVNDGRGGNILADYAYPDNKWIYPSQTDWIYSKNYTTNFYFITTVIPMRWDNVSTPTVTRISDWTVHVQVDSFDDLVGAGETNNVITANDAFIVPNVGSHDLPSAPNVTTNIYSVRIR